MKTRRRKIIKEHFPVGVAWRQVATLKNFSTPRDVLKLSLIFFVCFYFNKLSLFSPQQNLPGPVSQSNGPAWLVASCITD